MKPQSSKKEIGIQTKLFKITEKIEFTDILGLEGPLEISITPLFYKCRNRSKEVKILVLRSLTYIEAQPVL